MTGNEERPRTAQEQHDQMLASRAPMTPEKVALAKETDAASAERLATLDRELADLREERDGMLAHWDREKSAIAIIRGLKEQLEQVGSAVERESDLEKAA